MTTSNLKTQIIGQLDQLSPKLLNTVHDFVSFLVAQSKPSTKNSVAELSVEKVPTATAIDDDPIVGLIKGPSDLATNAEEILTQEIKPVSGWSCK